MWQLYSFWIGNMFHKSKQIQKYIVRSLAPTPAPFIPWPHFCPSMHTCTLTQVFPPTISFHLQCNICAFRIFQLDSVEMNPVLLATSKASQLGASRTYTSFSPSGLVRVWPWPCQGQSFSQPVWSDACQSWHPQWTPCTIVFCLLCGWLLVRGSCWWHRGQLAPPGVFFPGYLGCLPSRSVVSMGREWRAQLIFCACGLIFSLSFLQSLCFGFGCGRTRGSLHFQRHLREKVLIGFLSTNSMYAIICVCNTFIFA